MLKVAAIVIIYKPDLIELKKNIEQYIHTVERLIVWKNSTDDLSCLDSYGDKIVYLGDGTNRYIAEPLNFALEWCQQNKYDYLMTMDQDSTWSNFSGFIKEVDLLKEENVVIYSPNVNDQYSIEETKHEVKSVITSGSLHNVDIARKLGGFREDYKIYWVDGEFCYWSLQNGYKIILLSQYNLQQEFGKQKTTRFSNSAANYSATSYYFLFRNMLWMRREFPKGVSLKCILYTSKVYILSILSGEENMRKKLLAVTKAFLHGIFNSIPQKRG